MPLGRPGRGPVDLRVVEDLGLLERHREDDDLLLVVEVGGGRCRWRESRSARGSPRPAVGAGSSVPRTCMPWRSALTDGLVDIGRLGQAGRPGRRERGLTMLKATTASTKSPALMTVPTPLTWSTLIDMATLPAGTSMLLDRARVVDDRALVISWPAVTAWRAICPTTSTGVRVGVGRLRREVDLLEAHLVLLDGRPEVDVLGRHDDVARRGRRRCGDGRRLRHPRCRASGRSGRTRQWRGRSRSAGPAYSSASTDVLPESCDRWHHSSTAISADD